METGGKDVARAAEEEVLKRNTDCVYFLASPLTCKKGVECEYRHSEGARVNPRDCWFWLNGNCLNPKCSFRHPPLDGLIGTPTTTGPTLPGQPKISTQPSSTHFSAAHNPNKQGVPCYYYQRGGCLKGDRCPYLHGTTPIPNPVSQQVPKVSAPVSAPSQSMKKTSWSLDKISQQNIPKETSHQHIEIVTPVKPPARADTPAANGMPMKETLQSHVEFPSIPGTDASLGDVNAPSMPQSRQSEPLDDDFQNEGEGNGYFRESSPGFDVLVDDENEDPGYFCEEDELEGAPGHDGRSLNPAADFEYHPSSDYETAGKFRGVSFVDADEYDHHVRGNDYYTPEHGAFPERELELPSVSDRRRSRREDNVSRIDGSDLRHRLLKKRRVNASRSGVSPDRHEVQRNDDHYFEEHRYRAHGRRNDPRNDPRDIPIGKRLQGRLSLPVRIPADNSGDRYSEREVVLGRNSGRLSPIRPTNYHARGLHDRINMRSSERYRSDEKNIVAPSTRSDELVIQDFAGPKRLSELKSRKVPHIFYHRSIGGNDNSLSREQRSMRMGKALGHQEADSVPFEGPQPLSVILKRKREASAVNSATSGNEELNGKGGEDLTFSYATSAAVTISSQIHRSSESARKNDRAVDPEVAVVDIEEDDPTVGDVVDQPSAKEGANGTEVDALEYNDEGEYGDYEQGDEEYYQENEDAEYEPEGGEDMYEEEAEGNEEGDEDCAQKLAMCN